MDVLFNYITNISNDLKKIINRDRVNDYFEMIEGTSIKALRLNINIEKMIKYSIISGAFNINEDNKLLISNE